MKKKQIMQFFPVLLAAALQPLSAYADTAESVEIWFALSDAEDSAVSGQNALIVTDTDADGLLTVADAVSLITEDDAETEYEFYLNDEPAEDLYTLLSQGDVLLAKPAETPADTVPVQPADTETVEPAAVPASVESPKEKTSRSAPAAEDEGSALQNAAVADDASSALAAAYSDGSISVSAGGDQNGVSITVNDPRLPVQIINMDGDRSTNASVPSYGGSGGYQGSSGSSGSYLYPDGNPDPQYYTPDTGVINNNNYNNNYSYYNADSGQTFYPEEGTSIAPSPATGDGSGWVHTAAAVAAAAVLTVGAAVVPILRIRRKTV